MPLNIFYLLNFLFQLKDIQAQGCSSPEISAATYRTFIDLCEIRKYESVTYNFSTELGRLYIKAQKKLDEEQEIIVPMVAAKSFNFKEIEKFQNVFSSNVINIAICDSSSMIMYYKMTKS